MKRGRETKVSLWRGNLSLSSSRSYREQQYAEFRRLILKKNADVHEKHPKSRFTLLQQIFHDFGLYCDHIDTDMAKFLIAKGGDLVCYPMTIENSQPLLTIAKSCDLTKSFSSYITPEQWKMVFTSNKPNNFPTSLLDAALAQNYTINRDYIHLHIEDVFEKGGQVTERTISLFTLVLPTWGKLCLTYRMWGFLSKVIEKVTNINILVNRLFQWASSPSCKNEFLRFYSLMLLSMHRNFTLRDIFERSASPTYNLILFDSTQIFIQRIDETMKIKPHSRSIPKEIWKRIVIESILYTAAQSKLSISNEHDIDGFACTLGLAYLNQLIRAPRVRHWCDEHPIHQKLLFNIQIWIKNGGLWPQKKDQVRKIKNEIRGDDENKLKTIAQILNVSPNNVSIINALNNLS